MVRGHKNSVIRLSNNVINVSVNSKCYHLPLDNSGAFDDNFCLGGGGARFCLEQGI